MSTSKDADPSSSPADETVTSGFGHPVTAQDGSSPSTETQAETGGSGGDGLTRNQAGDTTNAPDGGPAGAQPQAGASGSALTHTARGAQDTRPDQASKTGTGLGTPETGGNQEEGDLPPR